MKKLSLILFAAFFLCVGSAVYAAPAENPTGPGIEKKAAHVHHKDHRRSQGPTEFQGHRTWRHLGDRLDLTQEQREKTKEIGNRFRADVHDLRYDLRIKKLEVEKLFTDPKTDDATLLAKEKELNALRLKLMDKRAEMKAEWRKLLTAEQITRLGSFRHHRGLMAERGPMGNHMSH